MSEIHPIKQSALGDQVAHELRRLIITGRYAPGTSLVEGHLAEQFNLSRGPIRDAIKTLAAEGLLDTNRRSATVVGLSVDDIDELFSLRESMERLALEIALRTNRPALKAELEKTLDTMRRAAETADPEAYTVADLQFHSVFYSTAEHRRLGDVWAQYRPTIEMLLLASNERYEDLRPSVKAHEVLAGLIGAADPEEVFAELHSHLDNARRRLREPYSQERRN
ncbi:DNA-binding GntR family transcriptional regulator [Spinactinospora alkalitolerans]|uniref:DNA-binding GntR family transcriptional regulator n=1 Tax=Spinactinospora alkalitolerans TaxID=687207 RepID=A0A852TW99_9ACTN|nr:GntR family transcriptional regulator [Spinactinospora alkalitolerans]NYE47665.1 DNA-binding GntR family transcriptional regulator [Spinactinospora alkalitolerans]